MAEENAEPIYVVYDERAKTLSVNEALALHATADLEEAKAYAREHRGVVYAYHLSTTGEVMHEECVYYEPEGPVGWERVYNRTERRRA
jgi:hypothetical protein